MRWLTKSECRPWFEGKRVAVVGSGPGVLENLPGLIDGHDTVVRVNNYKTVDDRTGRRCDVFYSYFGTSIRKSREQLIADGVTLCMCKVPNAHAIESDWHRRNGKMIGVDYRPHFARRAAANFWFCDTYVPTVEEFLVSFNLLGQHQPTSGFAAILDVLSLGPAAVHLTGFDFFRSGIHNLDEAHQVKNLDDPLRHEPERERAWLAARLAETNGVRFTLDPALERALAA